jgi:hypothetical protein
MVIEAARPAFQNTMIMSVRLSSLTNDSRQPGKPDLQLTRH